MRARLDPAARYGLRVTLVALAVILVAVPFTFLLVQVLHHGPLTRVDLRVAGDLHRWMLRHRSLYGVVKGVSLLGKPLLLGLAVAVGCAYTYWRGRARLATYLLVAAIGGGLVDSAVKVMVNRPRPVLDEPIATAIGKSFPSGHAMSSMVTYGALLLIFLPALRGRWRVVGIAGTATLVFAIGLSRILLGVHYVSDVIAGWTLGLAWLLGATAAFSIWRTEEGKPPVDVSEGVEPEAAPDLRGEDTQRVGS
jgi:undecaprenyl-diphosphatase